MLLEVTNRADIIFEHSDVGRVLLLWGGVNITWHVVGLSHVSFLHKFLFNLLIGTYVFIIFAFFALSAFFSFLAFFDFFNFGLWFLETWGDGLGLNCELVAVAGFVVDLGLCPLVLGIVRGSCVLIEINIGPRVVDKSVLTLVSQVQTIIATVQEVVVLIS